MTVEQRKNELERFGFVVKSEGESWIRLEKKDVENTRFITLVFNSTNKVIDEDVFSTKTVHKVGSAEFYHEDLKKIAEEEKYVCTSSAIYQIMFSPAQKRYYGNKVADIKGIAQRGRYYLLTAKQINNILGYDLLNEKNY